MQAEDWGNYTQVPWMTGGAWKATNVSPGAKETKAKQSARTPTTEGVGVSSEDISRQSEDRFRAEVDIADLRMKMRRWNFARSWKSPSSSPLDDDSHVSPWDVDKPSTCRTKAPLCAEQAEKKKRKGTEHGNRAARSSCPRANPIAKPHAPLDRHLIGQYLDRCIAATESQLAGARNKSKKKGAVKEIERLVEKVIVTQAGLGRREAWHSGFVSRST